MTGRGEGLDWFHDNTSHSGHERNHLFVNNLGNRSALPFVDVSGISGADSPADARASVYFDYDRDGFLDLAVANANAPRLELYKNRYAVLDPRSAARARSIAVRLVGGNRSPDPDPAWSPRDPYGALLEVRPEGGELLRREHRGGEGFAAQNSDVELVGLGTSAMAEVRVRWPSGRTSEVGEVRAGTLVTVYENPADTDAAGGVVRSAYAPPTPPAPPRIAIRRPDSRLVLYTTLATWCAACRAEIPALRRLRRAFSEDELALVGVPTDPEDSVAALTAWRDELDPPYDLVLDLDPGERETLAAYLIDTLKVEAYPSIVVTDRYGRVLDTRLDLPTVSELRRLLDEQ